MDLRRGARSRLTFGPVGNNNPVWSPDGNWVAYNTITKQGNKICRRPAAGGNEEDLLQDDHDYVTPSDWSRDGKFLLFTKGPLGTQGEIWAMPLAGDRKPFIVVPQGNYYVSGPLFSPDGRWVLYQSNESGRPEIYVIPFPGGQGKWQVSTTGGLRALWRGDGKEIFYTSIDRVLTAVPIAESGGQVHIGTAQQLFRLPADGYSAAPDGKKFLLNVVGDQNAKPITLVANWPAVLKK